MVVFPPTTPQEVIALILYIITSHTFITIIIFPGFIHLTLVVMFLTWYERKLLARIQLRIGPLFAGGPGGILQPIADGVKLIFKEVMIPYKADKPLFLAMPLMLVLFAALPFAVIPFGQHWVIANLEVGLVFLFAMTSLFPSMILIFAWASNSKFPFLGGLRSLFQQVAYEIACRWPQGSLSSPASWSATCFVWRRPAGRFITISLAKQRRSTVK